ERGGRAGRRVVGGVEAQPVFGLVLAGDVRDGAGEVLDAVELDRADADPDIHPAAILVQQAGLEIVGHRTAFTTAAVALLRQRDRLRCHEFAVVAALQLLLAAADHAGEGLVDIGVAVAAHDVDADLAVLDQGAVAAFRTLQGLLDGMALVHVQDRTGEVQRLPGFVADQADAGAYPLAAAVAHPRPRLVVADAALAQGLIDQARRSSGSAYRPAMLPTRAL